MQKKISILGSTGSIGLNSLKIISKKKLLFKINILAANKNYKLICNQIVKFKPKIFIINDLKVFNKVKKRFKKNKTLIINKIDFNKINIIKSDITIAGIPGIAGLYPTIKMIQSSKKILIANKESIICGWRLIKKTAKKYKTKIVPVDSEHFSIMKLIENDKLENIEKIYLTASGGPFLNFPISRLKKVKPIEATKHPKWKMGKKISVDSATLMNKMLEIIEAQKLFSIKISKIHIVIHPESLVHAVVKFKNGLYKFIYHDTTMIVPLANAIFDDKILIDSIFKPKKNATKNIFFKQLNFFEVDKKKFPIISLKSRLNEYISTPIIINAANEILVDQFLKKKIQFFSLFKHLLKVLNDSNYKKYAIKEPKNISEIFLIDEWARNTAYQTIKKNKNV